MSRLIVKNLPKNVTEQKLKELFSSKGVVTDVQLKYTKNGKFRRFCFVGYKNENEAQAALEYFDKTCIETCRITVELCAGLGDAAKPKSWSKYAADSSINSRNTGDKEAKKVTDERSSKEKKGKARKTKETVNEVKAALEKHKDDPLFAEFLESHAVTENLWSNDTTIGITNTENTENDRLSDSTDDEEGNNDKEEGSSDEERSKKTKIAEQKLTDLEYMEALKKKPPAGEQAKPTKKISKPDKVPSKSVKFFTVKVRGLGYNHKKKHVKQFFHPLVPKSIRVPPKIKGIAYVGFKTEKEMKRALNKNKSFLAGKRLYVLKYEAKEIKEETDANDGDDEASNPRWKQQEEALKDEESIAESGRMFIRNLAYSTTEDDVRTLFEKYGPLSEVNLPIDKTTRKQKGFGMVTFVMPEHAAKAYGELDGSILNGRMLHILPGKGKPSPDEILEQGEGTSYKDKKKLQNKATANSSHNWNTLFLGHNAVAEAIAGTYNTTKEKVLEDTDKGGPSVAVRLALGETQLVQDTQKFLEENGVHLDAFNRPPDKRSKTTILVKNLPAGTVVREIRESFARFGELGRVVMPPSGVTALVEFLEPSEARAAFTKLAYTKFKYLPLYLEWAPDDSFKSGPSASTRDSKNARTTETRTVKSPDDANEARGERQSEKEVEPEKTKEEDSEEDEEEEEEPEPDTTLFVKNVNFSTTEDDLKKHFLKSGPLHYATIATKKDPKNPGGKLSMGYAFVRYKRTADADRALKDLQMSVLDGKTLELKRSERILQSDVKTTKRTAKVTPQTGTKIMVRNIPFQAKASELEELFKAFGELKAVRLPKKMVVSEGHRGFAFIEYYTKADAKRAFKALCQSTHLYGRRLVLEWAQAEEGVEEIRKRTAKHFHGDDPEKKMRKSTLDPDTIGLAE